MKFLNCILFLWVIFGSGSTDLIESGSETLHVGTMYTSNFRVLLGRLAFGLFCVSRKEWGWVGIILANFARQVLKGEPSFFRVVLCCGAGEGVQQLNPPVRHRHNADPHLLHTYRTVQHTQPLVPVLRIHDILMWIRIRGSMHLITGSGSCYFHY